MRGGCTGDGIRGGIQAQCGRCVMVARRVDGITIEGTRRLSPVRDTVILEGSICDRYVGCARGMPFWWRQTCIESDLSPADLASGPSQRRPA